ncbi:MAG: endonuclease MutS2 [Oscillospiraceae bacterium]|nr:endonuclease MutS2 [Oscillospiraceae bacterium]
MSELYERSIIKLELDLILSQLADCADSALGKAACRCITPVSDLDDVRALLTETTVASGMSVVKGYPGFSGVCDVAASLERADLGGCLQPRELLEIAGVLRSARRVKDYRSEEDNKTVLDSLFSALFTNKFLEERIEKSILSEEEIADTASTELAEIRRHMRVQSAKIRDSLQKIISSATYSKFLREPIITIRQGRYVVPVKSECKNDVPGLVHDVSATGSTYFVEPMSAVSANNALKELELREKKEIERILAELSSQAAGYKDEILDSVAMLVRLDVIFAKAKLAFRMKACEPEMNCDGTVVLKDARHPLIDARTVVPVSLHLGREFDTMIITGPNTGGKTVTLKTIGLLTLMAECGLHIPAGDGSVLSTFDTILADIGDEQSIAQSISTFSSHMRTIVDIVNQCDSRTLVLFDELGAGTDPAEGAALAIALIEFCRKVGCRVVATTHYAEMKLYAMRTDGVINASCEFNVETLQPTYKLLIGVPGKSNAFAISKKLGLPEDILKEAADLVGQSDKDFEDVLSQLEQQRQQMEKAKLEAERLRAETENIRQKSEKFSNQIAAEKEKALEQARLQAQRIIEDARIVANAATEEIKAIKRQLSEQADTQGINQRQADLRRSLNEAEGKLLAARKEQTRKAPSRAVLVGDTVELLKLGTKASVIGINKDGTYQLQAGVLKLTAKPDEVYLLENENPYVQKGARPAHSGRQMKMTAMANEVDLRGMDSVEAVCVMERYLDEAMRGNLPSVRIIHGKGTGVLRSAVHQALRKSKYIKSYRLGVYGEGEDGVTIVEFK